MIDFKNQTLHDEPCMCSGCNIRFACTLRLDEFTDKSYCYICFGHLVELSEMEKLELGFGKLNFKLWSIPYDKLDKETRKQVTFIRNSENEVLEK